MHFGRSDGMAWIIDENGAEPMMLGNTQVSDVIIDWMIQNELKWPLSEENLFWAKMLFQDN